MKPKEREELRIDISRDFVSFKHDFIAGLKGTVKYLTSHWRR